ncbi:MAG: sensor histidine kinase, partial [Flavobacteriales bacterium]|nr:sensor histidine kinase [Flavobacteriales bacterium]
NEQLESSKRLLYAAVALAVLLLMAAVYFVWSKSRHNRNLAEKNVLIEKALAEKEILLREIHHRVKNNLQVVSSLLSIQSREIEDEKAQEAITESRNRVRSMALIHQNLYSDDYLTGIDMQDYVTKLSSSLFNTYKTDHDQIELRSDVAPMVLDVDTTIPLGLILNELITNALKYAFVGVTQGILSVYLKEENGQLVLRVSDNGVGMSEGSGRTDSFGLKMIKSFASKLEATWEIRNQGGMTVELRISKYRKAA